MVNLEARRGREEAPVEIERKWLIDMAGLPRDLGDYKREWIEQGYLVIGSDGSEARVRNRAGQYTETIKSKGDLSRGEYETSISKEQFDILWPATEGKRIQKTRFSIPLGGRVVELDIYSGALSGLIVAEVEFLDEGMAGSFEVPDWFGDEVTYDKSYKNQSLALNGLSNTLSQL